MILTVSVITKGIFSAALTGGFCQVMAEALKGVLKAQKTTGPATKYTYLREGGQFGGVSYAEFYLG